MIETDTVGSDAPLSGASAGENAALIERFYQEIFNQGNLSAADDIVAFNFVDHISSQMPGQPTKGPEAVKWFAGMYRTAFPNLRVTIDDLMTAGDRVITRVTWHGTQEGQLLGADPTNKQVRISGIDISRIAGGRIVEHWGQIDVLGMLSQLDFLPPLQ